MEKEKAYEIKRLWEEIVTLEGLAEDDKFHSLEYLAKRLDEAKPLNYPNTESKLHELNVKARHFIQAELATMAQELKEKLDKI